MARITVEDCLEVVDNRFELVMMAAKRARQLANGVESQIDNSESNDKPTVLALREIAARRIDNEYIDAVEKAERERKEGAANHPLVQAVLSKFPGAQIVNVIERSEKAGEDAETEILGEEDAAAAHETEEDDDLF